MFKDYLELKNQLDDLRYKIQTLKESYYGISGVSYDEHVKSTSHKTQVARIQEIDEYVAKYDVLKAQCDELYEDYNKKIMDACNETQARVLRGFYLLGMSINEVAESIGITPKHAQKVKSQALQKLKLS